MNQLISLPLFCVGSYMNSQSNQHFRTRVHWVIDELSDDQLSELWHTIAEMYHDAYLLKALQTSKRSPGDSFTRDEALQFLHDSGMTRHL